MSRLSILLFVLATACQAPSAPSGDVVQDTAGTPVDSDTQVQASSVTGHSLTGSCSQGQGLEVDLGTTVPVGLQVEVTYENGQAEVMVPDFVCRSSLGYPDFPLYESPLYRDGSLLIFTCGYKFERLGPVIDGESAGEATSYRISWMVL